MLKFIRFTLYSLNLVKEEAVRTWSKFDHANDYIFAFIQKAVFDPAIVNDD